MAVELIPLGIAQQCPYVDKRSSIKTKPFLTSSCIRKSRHSYHIPNIGLYSIVFDSPRESNLRRSFAFGQSASSEPSLQAEEVESNEILAAEMVETSTAVPPLENADYESNDDAGSRHMVALNRKGKSVNKAKSLVSIPKTATGYSLASNAEVASWGPGSDVKRSLGVDFGDRRTGLAVSYKGFSPRVLTVSDRQRGELVEAVIVAAVKENADEIILGLPRSWDYTATTQTEKTIKFGGFLARKAAMKGIRVYLFDEFQSSKNAMSLMVQLGANKRTRRHKLDAYAAMSILETYFECQGKGAIWFPPMESYLQNQLKGKYPSLVIRSASDSVEE